MLTPLPPEEWPDELAEAREELRVPLHIHQVLANHPALFRAYAPFRNYIVRGTDLDPRLREIIILRTSFLCAVQYEWVHHVARGKAVGMTDAEIERVRVGSGIGPLEDLLMQAVDECFHSQLILPETRDALANHLRPQQLLDVIAIVGVYMMMTLILETFEVPLEDDADQDVGG